MFNPKSVVDVFHHWYGVTAVVIGSASVLYYGPRKFLEAWDWYVDRFFDEPILQLMRDRKLVPAEHNMAIERQIGPTPPATSNTLIVKEGTYTVGDLSYITKRSRTSIGKSLRRLSAKRKIELYRGAFRLRS